MDEDKVYAKFCEYMVWCGFPEPKQHRVFERARRKIKKMNNADRINYYFLLEERCESKLLNKLSA